VIPLEYRLRGSVRLEPGAAGAWRVICEEPLTVLTVNAAAARLLKRTRYGATVRDIADGLGLTEERVLELCEYFRGRGLLDVGRAAVSPTPGRANADPAAAGRPAAGHSATSGWVAASPAPSVSIIVPTLDRADDLDQCLAAIAGLHYPADLLEVLVVDDSSADPTAIAGVVERHGARLLVNDRNRGPAASRNRAAREARGEILAFIDSDCVAGPSWLSDLAPYFSWPRVGAVGGRTLGYYSESLLDRYEEVSSPLDMGRHLMVRAQGPDTFYVPTCNLLVRRSLYAALGGLREDLRVGEDVDFCWRLRASDAYLVYAPEGIVRHKHRDSLAAMLRRRAQYGTSEAVLHGLHPDKRKRFPLAREPLATVALTSAAIVRLDPRLLPLCLAPALWDGLHRRARLRTSGVAVAETKLWNSVLRSHLSMLYFVYFHLTRYYLGPMTAAGVVSPGFWALEAAAVLYSAGVDYSTRKPRMSFAAYLAYYLGEHLAYQSGVVRGCVRVRSFRSYLPVFERRVAPAQLAPPA
jgi:mycofactocin glycosyltransferase